MKSKLIAAALASAVVMAAGGAAQAATTITFDSLANSGDFQSYETVALDGFEFTNSGGSSANFVVWGQGNGFNADPQGATLGNNYSSTTTTFVRTDAALFDFFSMDLADIYNYGAGGDVLFTFNRPDGSTTQTVSLDSLVGLQTFAFNQAGVSSVSYQPLSTYGSWIQADNVVVDQLGSAPTGAVPEPATWAMMLMGFFGLGAAVRSRRGLITAA